MSKSKAKKQREKREREGYRNPEESRVMWGFNPVERVTKTKKEKLDSIVHKHPKRDDFNE